MDNEVSWLDRLAAVALWAAVVSIGLILYQLLLGG